MLSFLLIALTATGSAALPDRVTPALQRLEVRLASGAEWDSNARRSISGSDATIGVNSRDRAADALLRLLLDSSAAVRLGQDHQLSLTYTLGAKRFFMLGSEDLFVHDLSLSTTHRLLESLTLSPTGTLRASRVRGGARDYGLGLAGLTAFWRVHAHLELDLGASFSRFEFLPERRFDFSGPKFGAGLTLELSRRLTLVARVDAVRRYYTGNAPLVATSSTGARLLTFCEGAEAPPGCEARRREDSELQLAAGLTHRGPLVFGVQYLLRRQRSNAELENLDRHRVWVFATVALPASFTGSVLAALQLNTGRSTTDNLFLAEDDENQNSLQVQFRRPLGDSLSIEARYALFANQFSTADVRFLRHTAYLGLSLRSALLN